MHVAGGVAETPQTDPGLYDRRRSVAALRSDLSGWNDNERQRVLGTYTSEVYGRPPQVPIELSWRALRETAGPAGSSRRQILLELHPRAGDDSARRGEEVAAGKFREGARLTLLVQVPGPSATDERPSSRPEGASPIASVPAFLGLNFLGNHTLTEDPEILDADEIADELVGSALHYEGKPLPTEMPPVRGFKDASWAADLIASRGYASVTASYLEIGPDTPDIFQVGLHPRLSSEGFKERPADSWGAITLWAWVLQRVLDALEQGMVPEIDSSRVIVHGHSRLGKTALWAAAQDKRFAAAISNNSGCMGAAIDRGIGESHEQITTVFPHWFAPGFVRRITDSQPAPVDQHQLLATIAPRPLYVSSASDDIHADPEGEFLAWRIAADVWGADSASVEFPVPDEAIQVPGAPLEYHLRRGKHSVERFDWEHWLDFADRWVHQR